MKSSRAIGESLSGSPLREDIRVRRPAAVHCVDGGFGHRLKSLATIANALAAIELLVTFPDGGLPGGDTTLLRLHATDRVADHLCGVAIKAAGDLALDDCWSLDGKIK